MVQLKRLQHGANLFALISLFSNTDAFWRMPCGQSFVTARMDPVVNPGQIASHVHAINGASNVDYTVTFDQLRASQCTTCAVQEDKSLYWTPQLYYVSQDGQYSAVGSSGLTVYYLQRGSQPVKAMPEGLRLVAGDSSRRSFDSSDVAQRAIGFSCIGGNGYNKDLRQITNCANGLRAEIFFPNCWDGVNLDSADHKSHVVYSGNDGNGRCPDSHPVKLVSIFFEQLWSVDPFKGRWWNGTTPPFVLANGDPTGFGLHADVISGWDKDFLQSAVDQCNNNSGRIEDCPLFNIQRDISSKCSSKTPGMQKFTLKTDENIYGPRATLPGCNSIQYGPEAAKPGVCLADGTTPSLLIAQPKPVGFSAASSSPANVVGAAQNLAAVKGDTVLSTPAASNPTGVPLAQNNAAPIAPSVAPIASIKDLFVAAPPGGVVTVNAPVSTMIQSQVNIISTVIMGVPTTLATTVYITVTLGDPALSTPVANVAALSAGNVAALPVLASPTGAPQTIGSIGADGRSTMIVRTTVTVRDTSSVNIASLASEAIEKARATAAGGAPANFDAVAASLANPAGVWTTLTRTEIETATITVQGQTVATQVTYVQLYVLPMTAASLLPASQEIAVETVVATIPATKTQTLFQTVMQTMTLPGGPSNGTSFTSM
ncbi:hypothetical protein BCR37DRAFT_376215 [Protomyces lactucae-debilis]|uniref:DUF1996 domain-containing protein n=1 Tax=Protomyces lactucae-debilis TaxID=2754530 RepID=A0A1Y2FSD5_PROLT|nr:uncharacterized protein BCR37DRAFT_376215 [Protomyces lactucae-debilis]ORY86922.1 hypothetical protein BCR37DRAFT_376215 [Protomyces lactucae-debilis]